MYLSCYLFYPAMFNGQGGSHEFNRELEAPEILHQGYISPEIFINSKKDAAIPVF